MKRITLWLLLAVLNFSVIAQSENIVNESETASWKNTLPRHEIQLGFGDPVYAYLVNPTQNVLNLNREAYMDSWFSDGKNKPTINLITTTHALAYKYRACKWFWVGATVTYTAFASIDYANDVQKSLHYITIAPEVRFSYLNKRVVTLYSGLNLGVGIRCGEIGEFMPVGITWHANLFGVEVGTRWYGYMELGIGNKGIVSAGFGYHFYHKK